MMDRIAIISFTDAGGVLAHKTAAMLASHDCMVETFDKYKESAAEYVARKFAEADALIFVGAAGIAVRLIAAHITTKDKDPAVIVMDEKGSYVVPLLSGHLGGANEMAEMLAQMIGARAVITTATDINGKFAADIWAKKNGCVIEDISMIKFVSAAVLKGENAGFSSGGFDCEGEMPECLTADEKGKATESGICISLSGGQSQFMHTLNVIPRIVTIGAGCKKDTDSKAFRTFILEVLKDNEISPLAVERLATCTLKKDERCMHDFAQETGAEFVTYTSEELMEAEGDFASSEFVRKVTGADNVCERSAVTGSGGRLTVKKTSRDGMTAAIAVREWKCRF